MIYTKEAQYGTNKRMYAEMFIDEAPASFPMSSDDVDDIKDGYNFTTGTTLYVVATGQVYMYNATSEEWVLQ